MKTPAANEAKQIIAAWNKLSPGQDVLEANLSWLETNEVSPRVEAALKRFEGMDRNTVSQTLIKLRSKGQYDILLQLGLGILTRGNPDEKMFSHSSLLFYDILSLLASAPHIPSLDVAFHLFDVLDNSRLHLLAILVASGVNAQIANELFAKYGVTSNVSRADVLLALVQELIVRGVNIEAILSIQSFLMRRQQFQPSLSDQLSWLPLKRLEIEDQIREDQPSATANSGFTRFGPYADKSGWGVPQPIDVPAYKEIINIKERVQIRIALEAVVVNLEACVFRFDTVMNRDSITPNFLVSLQLKCLVNTQQMQLEATTPNYVLSVLFAVACNGGPYGGGVGPAAARLKAWQSMAGLVGLNAEKSPEQIEEAAKQSHWFTFQAINGWFSNEWIDVGIALLRADNQTVVVLAGSATD